MGDARQSPVSEQDENDVLMVKLCALMTYHPVLVRRPLPRDFRGFLPLPATPFVADIIEFAKTHGHSGVLVKDPQLCEPVYNYQVVLAAGVDASRVPNTNEILLDTRSENFTSSSSGCLRHADEVKCGA